MKIEIDQDLIDTVSDYLSENGYDAPETPEEWSEYVEDCIRQSTDNLSE
jgi:hypothetical protein